MISRCVQARAEMGGVAEVCLRAGATIKGIFITEGEISFKKEWDKIEIR